MINKILTSLAIMFVCTTFSAQNKMIEGNKMEKMDYKNNYENNIVRLSKIIVKPSYIDEYNHYLKEEIEASMRLESGVLVLYAVSDKEYPNQITILEIYADQAAYQSHIKTPHFIKYKEGTRDMIQKLELVDVNPLIPGLKIK